MEMTRDFTYIDDITESIIKLLDRPAKIDSNFKTSNPNPSTIFAPLRIFNIGNSKPSSLMEYINQIELNLGIVANKEFKEMQLGDVKNTAADTESLEKWIDFKPNTSIKKV